jgi:hypothetical protein
VSMRRGAALLVGAVLAAGALGAAPVTLARFTASISRGASFGTATLAPPTNLAGTGGTTASLTWTASTSAGASGYRVLRSATSGSGYGQVSSVTPVSATGTSDAPAAGTWYYVLRTYFASWTSANSNQVSVVVATAPTSTGAIQCTGTSNAAETVNAGDNDGYESLPANACAVDGSVATDASTGTAGTTSCTANTSDKHRWWGYAFGLPATVTSIDGVTVTPSVGMNNNGGTTWLCVQLSSDGGATWTAAKNAVPVSTAITAYPLGGAADTWGRAWAVGDFGAGFQVRVIDSSTQPNKDLRLDALRVSVTYTP